MVGGNSRRFTGTQLYVHAIQGALTEPPEVQWCTLVEDGGGKRAKVMRGGRKLMKGGRKVTKGGRKVMKGGRKVMKGGRKAIQGGRKVMKGGSYHEWVGREQHCKQMEVE